MTYKTKRSLAQLGKHARNMPKLQHPDEAPTPSKQRCSHGYPVRRPPTRRRPRRTPPSAPPARPPSARPCAPSRPRSSWPAELANLTLPVVHTADEYSAAERKEMDSMYERHELLFPDDGSEL